MSKTSTTKRAKLLQSRLDAIHEMCKEGLK